MATPIQENLVQSNKDYAASFTKGGLALPPAKKYAVGKSSLGISLALVLSTNKTYSVTCMDARIDPASAYGIALGDAHVCVSITHRISSKTNRNEKC